MEEQSCRGGVGSELRQLGGTEMVGSPAARWDISWPSSRQRGGRLAVPASTATPNFSNPYAIPPANPVQHRRRRRREGDRRKTPGKFGLAESATQPCTISSTSWWSSCLERCSPQAAASNDSPANRKKAALLRSPASLAIIIMMFLAILICLCSEADAFIAASFVAARPVGQSRLSDAWAGMLDMEALSHAYTPASSNRG